jgi:hypothetical protein
VIAQASSSTLPEAAIFAPVLSPTPAPVVASTTVAAIPDASVAVESKAAPESAAPAAVATAAAAASSAAVATTADARPKALDSSDRDRDRADAKNSASSSSDTTPTVDDLQVHYEQQIRARMHEKPILELLRICQVTSEFFRVFSFIFKVCFLMILLFGFCSLLASRVVCSNASASVSTWFPPSRCLRTWPRTPSRWVPINRRALPTLCPWFDSRPKRQ